MKTLDAKKLSALALLPLFAAGCANSSNEDLSAGGRIENMHAKVVVTDPSVSSSSVSSSGVSTMATVTVNVGSIYLESQMAPAVVGGVSLQASDISVNGSDAYVSYSSVDNGTTVVKKGAVEHVRPYLCDNPLTLGLIEYCLQSATTLPIPDADIFASFSDGSNLYAVGSTLDETYYPNFARLYKINFDASKNPSAIATTVSLPSYAGTGVAVVGSKLFATSGTSTDSTKMGGLSVLNLSDLTSFNFYPLYDARDVKFNSTDLTSVYVTRAQVNGTTPSALIKYPGSGTGAAGTPIVINGNTVAESKSSLQVGKTLLIASTGDGGFKVLCKATGAPLASVAAVSVTGIPASKSVTNSIAAVPGYIFAADGEAGVFIYQFQKSALTNTNYCQGITLTQLGRLSLAASTTYVNAELSANSIYSLTFLDVLNAVTNRMLVIASGNKGTSLLNITNLNLGLLDVDDF